jgi:hypothetical protein
VKRLNIRSIAVPPLGCGHGVWIGTMSVPASRPPSPNCPMSTYCSLPQVEPQPRRTCPFGPRGRT